VRINSRIIMAVPAISFHQFKTFIVSKRPLRGRFLFAAAAVVLSTAAALWSQQPTFSSDVKVVNVLATVRDKQGKIVKDLTRDDFSIQEDGRPQAIKYFALE